MLRACNEYGGVVVCCAAYFPLCNPKGVNVSTTVQGQLDIAIQGSTLMMLGRGYYLFYCSCSLVVAVRKIEDLD